MSDDGRLRNIVADYCLLVDQKRYRDFADQFAENGRMIMHGELAAEGREAIFAWISDHFIPPGRHLTSNIHIDIDGDRASGVSSVMFVTAENAIIFVGDYKMTFVRTGGDWKIAEWVLGVSLAPQST